MAKWDPTSEQRDLGSDLRVSVYSTPSKEKGIAIIWICFRVEEWNMLILALMPQEGNFLLNPPQDGNNSGIDPHIRAYS